MWSTIVHLLALLAVAAAVPKREDPKFDQVQLTRQKDIVRLLFHYRQPPLWEDLVTIAAKYQLQPENYEVPQLVEEFLEKEQSPDFPAIDEPISVLDDRHVDYIKLFVDLMYYAKDYDTFYKTALYLRERVNKSQFIVSFLISVKLRHDTRDFILPRLYEINPELFVTSDVIQKVYDARLGGLAKPDGKPYVLKEDTGYPPVHTPEQRLSYFTEDVGLNEYFADFNYRYPYFLSAANYSILNGEVRGDIFYHMLRQLYARYFLERLSNGLPDVEPLSYHEGVQTGYNPQLRLQNGVAAHLRPENQNLLDSHSFALERIQYCEYRLSEVVDMGYVLKATEGRSKYDDIDATEMLGSLIQGNADSVHPRYYGALYRDLLSLVGKYDPTQRYGLAASALGKYETALRDPAYFQIVKRVLHIFHQYLDYLPPYTKEELVVPGVKVESVDVDRLVTYFDDFDFEVDNALKVSSTEETKIKIFARKQLLNHKSFTYHIKVSSEKPTKVLFRAFFGPRYDSYGNEVTLDEARQHFVEFDRFIYELAAGANEIARNSRDCVTVEHGAPSVLELLQQLESGGDFSQWRVGFPERLLLPRGSRAGLPLRLYVIASSLPHGSPVTYIADSQAPLAGDWFTALADGRAVGFPFDRRIPHLHTFRVPNSYIKDVVVFHSTADEINTTKA